jgi:hypothetical protein
LNKTTGDKEQGNLGQKVDYAIKRSFENLQILQSLKELELSRGKDI